MKDSIVNELITAMKDRLPPGQNLANFVGRSLLRLMRLRKFPVSWDQIIGNHLYNRVTFDMNLLRSANAIESYYEIIDRYLRI